MSQGWQRLVALKLQDNTHKTANSRASLLRNTHTQTQQWQRSRLHPLLANRPRMTECLPHYIDSAADLLNLGDTFRVPLSVILVSPPNLQAWPVKISARRFQCFPPLVRVAAKRASVCCKMARLGQHSFENSRAPHSPGTPLMFALRLPTLMTHIINKRRSSSVKPLTEVTV